MAQLIRKLAEMVYDERNKNKALSMMQHEMTTEEKIKWCTPRTTDDPAAKYELTTNPRAGENPSE